MDDLLTLDQVEEEQIDLERIELSDKQDSFIFSEAEFSGYGGGVGNGKTLAGCIKTYNHCDQNPGSFFLIGRRHATDLQDSTMRDFLQLFGNEGVFRDKSKSFKFPNGSEIIFRHLDDLKSLTNMNLSGFWIDQAEEVPHDAFIFLVGRIRRKTGRREGFITFNMNGHDWIWQRFKMRKNTDGQPLTNPESYHLVEATSMENKHLPVDYLERLMTMPKDWIDRFVKGSWDSFAGQIFDEWNEFYHVIDPFPIPNHWQRYRVIDHGQRNATCCLWAAVDFQGNVFFYQEYYQPGTVVSAHIKAIKKMSMIPTTSGSYIPDQYQATYIDPSTFSATREKNGRLFSVADEYIEGGVDDLVKAQNDVTASINRVKEYLRIRPERYHVQLVDVEGQPLKGAPKMYFFRGRCPNAEEEMQQYKWKPQRYGSEEDAKEAPVKKKDHAVDCVRYLIQSRPMSPEEEIIIDPRLLRNPMELARFANKHNRTVEDILNELRGRNSGISHSSSGIGHAEGIKHSHH